MKKRELEKLLRQLGWSLLRHGAKHDIWAKGEHEEAIPRHSEINEKLARVILRRAKRRAQ
ncbi:MAG: type II toxin-antitoxin system HicA family toxin [Gemmatimonadetes bacterium]|nr:type II toxin-antitoxin system HicA family toxin [Gemmatimonadota bacterium]MBT6144545.1 type II toxin-antitoxin system HicA family toxin [Gemmatimonadota bacterium]MBT7864675.1 type II toxin-antitoxin system HicA family toxin [Gemmatimonadota bacterium]